MAARKLTAASAARKSVSLSPSDIEELERRVRQGLAVALYMSESGGEHSAPAAQVIVEALHEARLILEGKEGRTT